MGDELESLRKILGRCEPPSYAPLQEVLRSIFPVDSPHGLAENVESLDRFFLGTVKPLRGDPIALTESLDLLTQLLDRKGSVAEISLYAPLVKGTFLDGIEVARDGTWIRTDLKLKDGYLDGEINFFPPVIQKDFVGHSDVPSNPVLGNRLVRLPIDVNLHRLKIETRPSEPDPAKNVTRIKALTSYLSAYIEIDVTEMITKRYLGKQMRDIDFPASEFVKMLVPHAKQRRFNPNMADITGARFNVKISSDGKTPAYDGPYQACAEGVNETCSGLLFHWDHLALGKTLSLHDVDAQVFVFPNPETNGLVVEIPTLKVGRVVQNLGLAPIATLTNARLENVLVELEPKGTNPLDVYPKRIKATISASELRAFGDIEVASLGTGIEIEIHGDKKGNLWTEPSKPISIPGLILSKADLIFRGAGAVHVADAALLDGQVDLAFRNGVLSYSASIVPSLQCASFSGILESFGVQEIKGAATMSCRDISATSQNAIFGDHNITINRCGGGLAGSAKLLAPLPLMGSIPLDIEAGTRFQDLDIAVTAGDQTFVLNRLGLPEFALKTEVKGDGFKAGLAVEDGSKRLFNGVKFPAGVTLTTGEDWLLTAQTNVVNEISVSGRLGSFRAKGPVAGVADLVNISPNPFLPNFRPVAGSLSFDMDTGASLYVFGRKIPLHSRTRVFDDPTGRGILTNQTFVAKPLPVNIGTQVRIDLTDSIKDHQGVPYYDLPDGLKLAFASQVSEKHIGSLNLWGHANVSGLKSGDFHLDMGATVPLDQREISIPGGKIRMSSGKITASGNEKQVSVTVRPPEKVEVQLDQVIDGVTYEIRGSLLSKGSFHAGLRFADGNFRLKQHQPDEGVPLEGNLSVTARKDGKIVGAGEVGVRIPYELDAWSNPRLGRITIKFPEKMTIPIKVPLKTALGEAVSRFTVGELTLNPGDNVSIPFEMPEPIMINFSIRNLLKPLK